MTLIPWPKGKTLLWDATCVDTYASCHLNCSSIAPGSAANEAEIRKINKYKSMQNDYIFIPVGVETSGTIRKKANSFLHSLGGKLIQATGEKHSTSFVLQRVSIAVQRGNATSMLATHQKSHGLDEIYSFLFK